MTTVTYTPLCDAMYAMSVAQPIPDVDLVETFVLRYPDHAEALTEFAIELAVDALRFGDEVIDRADNLDSVSPAVSRVMSRFQTRLAEIRQGQSIKAPARTATASVPNPFAALDRSRFRNLATLINANSVLLSKLRDRQIDPVTIPSRFCGFISEKMNETIEALTAHFFAPPAVATGQSFKSEQKPVHTSRQSFEEAVRGSGLTAEQQNYLLSFRDK